MAKLRDQMIALDQARRAGARDATLRGIRELTLTLGPHRQVRPLVDGKPKGPVEAVVHTMQVHAVLRGVAQPQVFAVDLESSDGFGVVGELEKVVAVAMSNVLKELKSRYLKHENKLRMQPVPVDKDALTKRRDKSAPPDLTLEDVAAESVVAGGKSNA